MACNPVKTGSEVSTRTKQIGESDAEAPEADTFVHHEKNFDGKRLDVQRAAKNDTVRQQERSSNMQMV